MPHNISHTCSAGTRTSGPGGPREILVGHKDMASSGVRAYNGGLGGEAPLTPEAESLFVFGRLIMQYFAVFIRFSAVV